MAQRINRHMQLRSAFAFGAVIAGAWAALRRRTQGSAVDDGHGWLGPPPVCYPQNDAKILRQGLKAAGRQPALRLLVDRRPGRKIMRHGAPGDAVAADRGWRVEAVPQRVLALWRG